MSVVLPVYNGEATLSQSIESVLNQTYKNLELIIVNDGSTDGTPEILAKYAALDSRIKIINNPKNLKLPRSLNIGFESAKGDYYTWTSADNIYKENAIYAMLKFLEEHPGCDMVYADYSLIDSKGQVLRDIKSGNKNGLAMGNCVGACFMYTKEIANKVGGYNPDFFLAEDYEYWIRIFKAGRALHLSENLYYYRVHEKSLSATKIDAVRVVTYKLMERNFLYFYPKLRGQSAKFKFLANLEYWAVHMNKNEIRKILYAINPIYRFYVFLRDVKRALRAIVRKIVKF